MYGRGENCGGGSKSSSIILLMSADVKERTSGLEDEVAERELTPEEEYVGKAENDGGGFEQFVNLLVDFSSREGENIRTGRRGSRERANTRGGITDV